MPLYKQKNSSNWSVRIAHQGEIVRRSTGTDDREEAQRIHDEIKAELWRQPKLKGYTWGGAVLAWCEKRPRDNYDLLALKKFARYYHDRQLRDVTTESVHAALSRFCATASTYTRHRARIMSVLSHAVELGWLREVPRLVKREDRKTKPRDWITREQWEKLYAELPVHMKPMAEFAITTGLRQANVLKLRWSQVDLARRLVWIEAAEMKADAPIAVPLPQRGVEILQGRVGTHEEFVFTYQGRAVSEIKTAWMAACIRAGLGQYVMDEHRRAHYAGFTWHGLRHTWATWHIQNGTPVEVLQKLGGWADHRMVMNYAHHSAGHLAQYADNAGGARTI